MNVYSYVVIIYLTSLIVLSVADEGKPIQKRILKLKNVNFNKTEGKKPKSAKKSPKTQKNKTIFVLSNPVIYPQKLSAPEPSSATVLPKPTYQFDFLNFDAYILKPRNINYTALLSNAKNGVQAKELKLPEPTINYAQNEFLDNLPRAEPLIQTTTMVPTTFETLPTIPYEATPPKTTQPEIHFEPTTAKINSIYPLGLAYFDSLRKYRKAFDSLRSKRTKKPRIKTTTTTTTSTTAKTTETEEPFIETTTARDYGYIDENRNLDTDFYEEPHFESYRYKPRYHPNSDDEIERNRYETTTHSIDYDTLDHDDNYYESTEPITTTTPRNSKRRKSRNNNLHSSNVKSNNFQYDRYINYPQEDESRRVVSVARLDNYEDKRSARNNTQTSSNKGAGGTEGRRRSDGTEGRRRTGGTEGRRRTGGTEGRRRTDAAEGDGKKHKNTIPMQRHYFQYVNAINDGAYNAGVGKGNQNHYIEQHELSVPKNGTFQKRVRWNDKKGGFGELYYDLNHH